MKIGNGFNCLYADEEFFTTLKNYRVKKLCLLGIFKDLHKNAVNFYIEVIIAL